MLTKKRKLSAVRQDSQPNHKYFTNEYPAEKENYALLTILFIIIFVINTNNGTVSK